MGILKDHQKKITGLISIILIIFNFFPNAFFFHSYYGLAGGEVGAPPVNGSTSQTWQIEADDTIHRSNENITTKDIMVDDFGIMNWFNVSATVNGTLKVSQKGIFNLTECSLTLNGNLNNSGNMTWENVNAIINGKINVKSDGILNIINSTMELNGDLITIGIFNLKNSTLLINCSTLGEYFISIEAGGEFNISAGSNITAPEKALSIRVFYVSPDSKLYADSSNFYFIGYNSKFPGIKCEATNVIIQNSFFSGCHFAFSLVDNSGARIEDCTFIGNEIGINLSSSNNNIIQNCYFKDNIMGIKSVNSRGNQIIDSNFMNNSDIDLYLLSNSSNNIILNSSFNINHTDAIVLKESSSTNQIIKCMIQNSKSSGISFLNGSNENLISNCTLDNNYNNLVILNNSVNNKIINCTLIIPINLDILLDNSSELTSLNSTFDNGLVDVGFNSNLTVNWFFHIFVQNSTNAPISDANLTIWDNDNGDFEHHSKTNAAGWVKWVVCSEYYKTDLNVTTLTPHTVQVEKFGYKTNTTIILISGSKTIIMTLEQVLLFVPDLVPKELKFSNDYPLKAETITISAIVRNSGYLDFNNSKTNVTILFYADNLLINNAFNLSSIPIQGSTEIDFNWKVNVTNGSHSIRIAVNHDLNLTEVDYGNNNLTKEIIINSIPVAILNITPKLAKTYEDFKFDGKGSYNEVSEVQIGSYLFDFGDGTNSSWITNSVIYHNYSNDGNYLARVQVRDISGRVSAWSYLVKVTVINRPPVANFSITPKSGGIATEFEFNADSSVDFDGVIAKYHWNFSDGFTSKNQRPKHKFLDDIEHSIDLIVWDDDDSISNIFSKKLKVMNTPPDAIFITSKISANVSEEIIFNASGSSDIDDDQNQLEYFWDFDDGTFGFNSSIILHNFTEPGIYNVTLIVKDDDGNTDNFRVEINITKPISEKTRPKEETNIFWIITAIVIVITVVIILLMLAFITQTKKLRRLMGTGTKPGTGSIPEKAAGAGAGAGETEDSGSSTGAGAYTDTYTDTYTDSESGQISGLGEFTTSGKLDFVILKKSWGKRYMKFELHQTTKSPGEYVGLIWKSAIFDNSWQIIESVLDSKEKVTDYLQIKILAFNNKNWLVDYIGNGTILSEGFTSKPGQPISVSTKELIENNKEPAEPDEDDDKGL
jgi:parallel beta-helix repeat protein